MTYLTSDKLITYAKDFDYAVNKEQAKDILDLLEVTSGTFGSEDIQRALDFVINGSKSRYVDYF